MKGKTSLISLPEQSKHGLIKQQPQERKHKWTEKAHPKRQTILEGNFVCKINKTLQFSYFINIQTEISIFCSHNIDVEFTLNKCINAKFLHKNIWELQNFVCNASDLLFWQDQHHRS